MHGPTGYYIERGHAITIDGEIKYATSNANHLDIQLTGNVCNNLFPYTIICMFVPNNFMFMLYFRQNEQQSISTLAFDNVCSNM